MEYLFNYYTQNNNDVDIDTVKKILKKPFIKPRHRVSLLNYDESVKKIIPLEDIELNGIAYTEEYQNGQRRNVSLNLVNALGEYNLSIDNIWMDTKFSYEIGIEYLGDVIWFPKGIFLLGNASAENQPNSKKSTLQLKDKFFIFEGKTGTLDNAYEIPVGSTAKDVINNLLNMSLGNGYIYDSKPFLLDSTLENFKTKASIRVDEGGSMADIFKELATQMSAEYYYNEVGTLCFLPINDTTDDDTKPVIWTYSNLSRDLHGISLNYNNEDVVNVVKVVNNNIETGIYSAIAENNNPSSPICVERIGRRTKKETDSNIWNNDTANSLAKYFLRKSSCNNVQFSCPVSFNPILSVNNLCEVENNFLNLEREKLLINSISFNSGGEEMTLSLVNTRDLPFLGQS